MMEKKMLITAEQARDLSGGPMEKHLEILSGHIEKAAKDGKREVVIRQGPYDNWLYQTPKPNTLAANVIDQLKKAGYKVSLYYNESQFVDMGLKISWE